MDFRITSFRQIWVLGAGWICRVLKFEFFYNFHDFEIQWISDLIDFQRFLVWGDSGTTIFGSHGGGGHWRPMVVHAASKLTNVLFKEETTPQDDARGLAPSYVYIYIYMCI